MGQTNIVKSLISHLVGFFFCELCIFLHSFIHSWIWSVSQSATQSLQSIFDNVYNFTHTYLYVCVLLAFSSFFPRLVKAHVLGLKSKVKYWQQQQQRLDTCSNICNLGNYVIGKSTRKPFIRIKSYTHTHTHLFISPLNHHNVGCHTTLAMGKTLSLSLSLC